MATDSSQQALHWQRTRNLMIWHIVIWFIFAFLIHWFGSSLNKASFIGFPLGYYMAAQGSWIVFVVQLFVFDWQQNKIDVECGMAEEE